MGYSISQETYERIERNRAAGRLCQGSSRCSQRATRLAVCLLNEPGHQRANERGWYWSVFVVCSKHGTQMCEWPAFVNGAMLFWMALGRNDDAATIQAQCAEQERMPITDQHIHTARLRMQQDTERRQQH